MLITSLHVVVLCGQAHPATVSPIAHLLMLIMSSKLCLYRALVLCCAGDIVFLVSDGVSDNFDPGSLKLAQAAVPTVRGAWAMRLNAARLRRHTCLQHTCTRACVPHAHLQHTCTRARLYTHAHVRTE